MSPLPLNSSQPRRGFTLIELLIVVAIIAILAAIAVPNFLEAQTRAKVSRTLADMRSLATGMEAFRVDHNLYPVGTDNPAMMPQEVADAVTQIAGGYDFYTFATRDTEFAGTTFMYLGEVVGGSIWHGLTTPVAFVTTPLADPFVAGGRVHYAYRESRDSGAGTQWILTSVGPDSDLRNNWRGAPSDRQEPAPANPFAAGTPLANAFDALAAERTPSEGRHGDISERGVEADSGGYGVAEMEQALRMLSYDPTNGTVSDGDLWRVGPGGGTSGR
jgi:prepilin-type N-terminal cleavage/methylation domain-containing protein